MKTIIKTTSRHPAASINWLVKYAAAYVYRVAQQEQWSDRLDRYPVRITVANTRHAYCGRYFGLRRYNGDQRARGDKLAELQRCFLVRVGPASKYPCDSTYNRYKDMPEGRLESWQEAIVGVTAHELAHTRYNYDIGNRKDAEIMCEYIEQDCVNEFRKHGAAKHDAFVSAQQQRTDDRLARQAAKRAPEALLATAITKAESAVARWSRKAKLAATKLKFYERTLKRLQAKAQKINTSTGD